ncbi:MAG: hypothetical protein COA78_24860 [Blastopirellula sp.]|nr:MAG: hypothetical protein COA78_24860 [Blastopirellula sp.]
MKLLRISQAILNQLEKIADSIDSKPLVKKEFFTIKEAAHYASLSDGTIANLISSRKIIVCRPVKGSVRIPKQQFHDYLMSCKTEPRQGRGRKAAK